MKRIKDTLHIGVISLLLFSYVPVKAQSPEVEQLLLNVEKLAQLKQLLKDMQTGYRILDSGYRNLRELARGNFQLHHRFLDELWKVNTPVRNYWKVREIMARQQELIRQIPQVAARWRQDQGLGPQELQMLHARMNRMLESCSRDLNELLTLLSDYALRMNDAGRLKGIDALYERQQRQISGFWALSHQVTQLSRQRIRAMQEIQTLGSWHGLSWPH